MSSQPTPEQPITTEFIRCNGQTFEVFTCGRGDKLALCLHGFPEHALSWRRQLPMLAALGYRAWAPNQRGYGRSKQFWKSWYIFFFQLPWLPELLLTRRNANALVNVVLRSSTRRDQFPRDL